MLSSSVCKDAQISSQGSVVFEEAAHGRARCFTMKSSIRQVDSDKSLYKCTGAQT